MGGGGGGILAMPANIIHTKFGIMPIYDYKNVIIRHFVHTSILHGNSLPLSNETYETCY